jgi:hypothetical protein
VTRPASRRPARRLGLALVLLAAAAPGCGSVPPQGYRQTSLVNAYGPFRAMRDVLNDLARAKAARDAAAARALTPRLLEEGKRFVDMKPPPDLKRENVPAVLEARSRYMDRLNAWDAAAAGRDDAALWVAADGLESGFWAWFDAYRGRAPEGAV